MKLSLLERDGSLVEITLEGKPRVVTVEWAGTSAEIRLLAEAARRMTVLLDGQRHAVELRLEGTFVETIIRGRRFVFRRTDLEAGQAHEVATAADPLVRAIVPGRVLEIRVVAGERVEAGQVLAVIDAMKMENPVVAPMPGTVVEIAIAADERVSQGQILIRLEPDSV